jgi:hypothetical protein
VIASMPATDFASRDLIDEVKTDVASRPVELRHGRQSGQSPRLLVARRSAEHPGFPHPVEHIGEPLLRASRLAVRAQISRAFGQAGEQRALLQGELLRRFAEIAARRHFDAPGTPSEIDQLR